MIANERFFQRLMTVLRNIDRRVFLSKAFEDYLRQNMNELYYTKVGGILCKENLIPTHAYFIIRGVITLSFYDDQENKHVTRIYRENRICGLISFILQLPSDFTITVSKDAILLSIDHKALSGLYALDDRLKEFVYIASMHYERYKERFRQCMLYDKTVDEKVVAFYRNFKGLLNRRGLILDEDIARYLHTSVVALQRSRAKLPEKRKVKQSECMLCGGTPGLSLK